MEKAITLSMALTFLSLMPVCKALESPNFTVIHSESDFEIRLYKNSDWMTAPVKDKSFQKATQDGFNRLFQYIQGANLNSSTAEMTKPVLTSVVSSLPRDIRFSMPVKFQGSPPVPRPQLNLKADSWSTRCVAAHNFSGFATDSNVVVEAEKLVASLSKSKWASLTSKNSYSIAQYNSPFRLIGRQNEVWLDVNGCKL